MPQIVSTLFDGYGSLINRFDNGFVHVTVSDRSSRTAAETVAWYWRFVGAR